jgi:hypothetical protein
VQSFLLEQVLTSGRTFTFTLFYQSDQPGSSLLTGLSRGIGAVKLNEKEMRLISKLFKAMSWIPFLILAPLYALFNY